MRIILLGWMVLLLSVSCDAQRKNDPNSFLSTQGKRMAVITKAAEFQPGDTVVDIGSGSGWFAAAFGIAQDSLTFYLEDLDSTGIKLGSLNQALTAFTGKRGKAMTCRFVQIVGRERSTGLPDAFCQRIFLIDTYHHLSFRDDMIRDMKRILKADGRVIVYEPLARKPHDILKTCRHELYSEKEIISSFENNGFRAGRTYPSVNNHGKKVRVFTFYGVNGH